GFRTRSPGVVSAAFFNGTSVQDLPFTVRGPIASSRAIGINDEGDIIGSYVDAAQGVHGFRFMGGTTTVLPTVGTAPAIPVAINDRGQVAANYTDAAGHAAALIIDSNGGVVRLGNPAGYGSFQVRALNSHGWAVGTASSTLDGTTISRAFLYVPGS